VPIPGELTADKNSAGIWTDGNACFKVSCTLDLMDDVGATRVAAERLVLPIVLVLLPAMKGEGGGWGTKALTVKMVLMAATSTKTAANNFILVEEGLVRPVAVKGRQAESKIRCVSGGAT